MQEYISARQGAVGMNASVFKAAAPLSKSNAAPDVLVVRGSDWKWGDEDGGAGKPGRVLSVCRRSRTVVVHWEATGIVERHYRLEKQGVHDLCLVEGLADRSRSKTLSLFMGLGSSNVRNSQMLFADRHQTMIVLDWDDTLFPSTFVRTDMRFNLGLPLQDQRLSPETIEHARAVLAECAASAERLLRLCASCGKVVIVTLARMNWVADSCKFFYPGIARVLKELRIETVYARYGMNLDAQQVQNLTPEETAQLWSQIKGKAISEEIGKFYSQYEGQSWKNVISIGDSVFEKLGTMGATAGYMHKLGIQVPDELALAADRDAENGGVPQAFMPIAATATVVNGHTFQVRTKVAKMLDEPTADELRQGLQLVHEWLPLIVGHDGGLSIDLGGLRSWEEISEMEDFLRSSGARMSAQATTMTRARAPCLLCPCGRSSQAAKQL